MPVVIESDSEEMKVDWMEMFFCVAPMASEAAWTLAIAVPIAVRFAAWLSVADAEVVTSIASAPSMSEPPV